MRVRIYAVKDLAVRAFETPGFAPAIGGSNAAAIRGFTDQVNNSSSRYHAHPEDYELYQLGEFNDEDGSIVPLELPQLVTRAIDVMKVQPLMPDFGNASRPRANGSV